MRRSHTTVLAILVSSCTYEAPLDPDAPPLLNVIDGEVVFVGEGAADQTTVLLFDADTPPPPAGTGTPISFATIPAASFTGEGAGVQSASYALTRVPDGDWLVSALMDADGDFNPFTPVLSGATCGDWLGSHVEDLAGTPAEVSVSGEHAIHDVTVLIGQEVTTERPVFSLVGSPELSIEEIVQGAPPLFRLRADALDTRYPSGLEVELGPTCAPDPALPCDPGVPACPCDPARTDPCDTALWVELRDTDGDGVVDPYPDAAQAEAGLLDVWPRIYLEHLGAYGTFEHEGALLPERWVAQAHPLAAEILFAAATAPGGPLPPGVVAAGLGPVGEPFPTHELSATLVPIFLHYHAAGQDGQDSNGPFDLIDPTGEDTPPVPVGAWSVTVISAGGQTWTLPNDVGLLDLPPLDPDLDPTQQGKALTLGP